MGDSSTPPSFMHSTHSMLLLATKGLHNRKSLAAFAVLIVWSFAWSPSPRNIPECWGCISIVCHHNNQLSTCFMCTCFSIKSVCMSRGFKHATATEPTLVETWSNTQWLTGWIPSVDGEFMGTQNMVCVQTLVVPETYCNVGWYVQSCIGE